MKSYLPYYFKKIAIVFVLVGFALSFTASIDEFAESFADGYNSASKYNTGTVRIIQEPQGKIISAKLSARLIWISLGFSLSGLLMYMFSREKAEDEFIEKLRYMSLAKSLLYIWIIGILFMIIYQTTKFGGIYILQLQLVLYVIIYNYYKKWKFA